MFFVSLLINIVFSSLAFKILVWNYCKTIRQIMFCLIVLIGSVSFVSYTTSGLENSMLFFLGACFMGEKGFPRCWCGGVGSGGYVLRTLDAAVRAPFLLRLAGNLPNVAVRAPKLLRLANGLHVCFRRFVADCSCGEHMAYTFAS